MACRYAIVGDRVRCEAARTVRRGLPSRCVSDVAKEFLPVQVAELGAVEHDRGEPVGVGGEADLGEGEL